MNELPRDLMNCSLEGKTESGISYKIQTHNLDAGSLIEAFLAIADIAERVDLLLRLRTLCTRTEQGLPIPSVNHFNQRENLCLAAAAVFPRSIPIDFVEGELGVSSNSHRPYVTATSTYETAQYLSYDENGIRITWDGVLWISERLESDNEEPPRNATSR